METKFLIILSGPPGSGKSTFANKLGEVRLIYVVSRDNIRFSYLNDEEDYFAHEEKVKKEFYNRIDRLLKQSSAVVVADATNLTKKARKPLIDIGKRNNANIGCIYFSTSLKKCKENNLKRSGREKVPFSVIKKMFFSFEKPTKEEGIDIIEERDEKGMSRR